MAIFSFSLIKRAKLLMDNTIPYLNEIVKILISEDINVKILVLGDIIDYLAKRFGLNMIELFGLLESLKQSYTMQLVERTMTIHQERDIVGD